MKKLELLAPAGNMEKLKMAIIYGADAVYIGGKEFSLRAYADNFDFNDMKEAIDFVHSYKRKIYLAINIIARNDDISRLKDYIISIEKLDFDAYIVSDPGILYLIKDISNKKIHLSTQANTTNYMSAEFWKNQGVKRIVLARELSLKEIKEIYNKSNMELEIFIHGAMCISYSGRCLLSNYMAERDSNQGLCAHPCRWKYHLVEEKRPGEFLPVYEDEKGTFIFNSKDLCMIEHIAQIAESGVSSIKIEGRVKSSFYVATIVSSYRQALDNYYESFDFKYKVSKNLIDEVHKVSHREFTTGFYFDKQTSNTQVYNTSSYIREYEFIGLVLDYDEEKKEAYVEQRNRFFKGDKVEILTPSGKVIEAIINVMKNEEGIDIDVVPHPQMKLYVSFNFVLEKYSMIRKVKKQE